MNFLGIVLLAVIIGSMVAGLTVAVGYIVDGLNDMEDSFLP